MDEFPFGKIDRARKLLGLGEDASLKEIKEAYRRKAKKFHPDFLVTGWEDKGQK